MYAQHFGLETLPFENNPDPKFFFDRGQFKRIHDNLLDSIHSGRGLMIVTGPIGSGKTTLSQKLMSNLPPKTKLIWLAEPPADPGELFMFVAKELGLKKLDLPRLFIVRNIWKALNIYLDKGWRCLMIIDESHRISEEVLEAVQILNNLEKGGNKLLQMLIIGQNELDSLLEIPKLSALKQRISFRRNIGKMSPDKARAYIIHRLRKAGARKHVFTQEALSMIPLAASGVPRLTNSLCHESMLAAFERGARMVTPADVHAAALELGLGRETGRFLGKLKSKDTKVPDMPNEVPESPEVSEDQMPTLEVPKPPKKKKSKLFWVMIIFLLSLCALGTSLWLYVEKLNLVP